MSDCLPLTSFYAGSSHRLFPTSLNDGGARRRGRPLWRPCLLPQASGKNQRSRTTSLHIPPLC